MKQKWRPRLSLVVLMVLGLVLCLPFAGLLLVKFYANQLVQQTEESLLGQASVLAANFAVLYGGELAEADPVFPTLSLSDGAILPPRPDAVAMAAPPDARYMNIAAQLTDLTRLAQQQTLVGYRILDASGNVIAGTAETDLSLAHVAEVAAALNGQVSTVARVRVRSGPAPSIYALSRGARVRVFVAMPVIVDDQVIGAVYLSRTPNHIFRFLFGERFNLAKALAFVLLATTLIGYVFWRFITKPIHGLIRQTQEIGQNGVSPAIDHFGTKEIATLSHSFQDMARSLKERREAVETFTAHVTHELKSPLTALRGAAELMRDGSMDKAQRDRFLDNILDDSARMEALLNDMRALARAEQPVATGVCVLDDITQSLDRFEGLSVVVENGSTKLPLPCQTLQIILSHLLENAAQHGATRVVLTVYDTALEVVDTVTGVSKGNRAKIMEPFFTTRREAGGTGMGLSIVRSMIRAAGGDIFLMENVEGAGFRLEFTS